MTDDLRIRIVAAIAAHEPVTDYDGADGECIECDLNPRWPDSPILPPSGGWKRHAEHLADAIIRELGSACIYRYACASCGDFSFDRSERMQRFALLHEKSHR